MIVKGIAKKYLGAISNELRAARLYDKYAMIIQGLQVIKLLMILWKIVGKNEFLIYKKANFGADGRWRWTNHFCGLTTDANFCLNIRKFFTKLKS